MDPSRYQQAKALFRSARSVSAHERRALLERDCAGDEELLREVLELLRAEGAAEWLEHSPQNATGGASSDGVEAEEPEPDLPERIGPYRVLRRLGWGGMGIVYLAEQESPRRPVAVKVLRRGVATPAMLGRFRREAELLGRLHHPHIARVFEAGRTEAELGAEPYLVMEYVEGLSLLAYARERDLPWRQRVRLVSRIAEAVHYAHEQGVIHRDLKPGNVLVDRKGDPKVLDFGVARAREDESSGDGHTEPGQLIGTLAYMSPEQAAGAEVDARSDVYSLGVLLYELLTERLPIATDGLSLFEAVRRITQEEPIPAGAVRGELRGDVEVMLAQALAKEPAERYASAALLAEDLRLFLLDRPIRARPTGTLYRLAKLVRRNRALSAAAAALFLALAGGLTTSQVLLRRANLAEERTTYVREAAVRLLDRWRLDALIERGERVRTSQDADVLAAWLAEGRVMAGRLAEHHRVLETLEAWMATPEAAEAATVTERDEAFLLAVHRDLVARLDAFCAARNGLLAQVEARFASLAGASGPGAPMAEERTDP